MHIFSPIWHICLLFNMFSITIKYFQLIWEKCSRCSGHIQRENNCTAYYDMFHKKPISSSVVHYAKWRMQGNKDIINECILITSFSVRKLIEYSMFIYPGACTLNKHRKRIHHEERARAQLLSLPVQPLFEQPDSYNPRKQRYPNVGFMHKWNVLLRVN